MPEDIDFSEVIDSINSSSSRLESKLQALGTLKDSIAEIKVEAGAVSGLLVSDTNEIKERQGLQDVKVDLAIATIQNLTDRVDAMENLFMDITATLESQSTTLGEILANTGTTDSDVGDFKE